MNLYDLESEWTSEKVWDYLRQASETNRVMPSAKVAGYRGFWPDIPKDPNEAYGYNEEEVRQGPATNRQATIWFEVSQWLVVLDSDYERDIVLSRVREKPIPFKVLQKRHSCSREKLAKDVRNCILTIAALLNLKADFHKIGRRKVERMTGLDIKKPEQQNYQFV